MKWNKDQCEAQLAGINALLKVKAERKLTKRENQVLAIARSHYAAYGCGHPPSSFQSGKITSLSSSLPNTPLPQSLANSTSNPNATMGFLDTLSTVVSSVTGSGRSNTSAPTPDSGDSSLLSTVGSIAGTVLGTVLGTPAVGNSIGTTLGTLAESSPETNGRAIAPVRLEAGGDIAYPGDTISSLAPRGKRLPASSKVRRLVHLVGVVNAASILGLAVPLTAMIAVRPYRRRGISAASLRITRRTIRAVNSINHSLSRIKSCTRRR